VGTPLVPLDGGAFIVGAIVRLAVAVDQAVATLTN